jgi:glycosyltransferase involved in cell wall biosynthesis
LASELRSGRTDKVAVVRPAPELSIIVPTFNECANVPILVERVNHVLAGCVFVDDNSADGTAAVARHRRSRQSRALHSPYRPPRSYADAELDAALWRFATTKDGDIALTPQAAES